MSDVRGACALYYSYQVRGADGQIKVPFRRRTCHSFVIAYITFLYINIIGAASQSLTDTGGTPRTVDVDPTDDLDIDVAAATTTHGLVVGTGTTAEAFTQTALTTLIAHGTGAGQLTYGASVVNLPSSDSTSTTLQLTRTFSNASGGTVTVQEIAIYAQREDSAGTDRNFCLARDLATIALSNGDQLTLNYILKTTA